MDETPSPTPPKPARFHGPELPGVIPTLASVVCLVVFIGIQAGHGDMAGRLQQWGWGPSSAVWHGRVWLLVTSAFVHSEVWHVAFNMYWLWQFGQLVEQILGRWKTLAFIIVTAAFSSTVQMFVSDEMGIGFSGVGYALFGFLWVARRHQPRVRERLNSQTVSLFVFWLVGCWIVTVMKLWSVANTAHVAGLAIGAALGVIRFEERWRRLTRAGLAVACALTVGGLFYAPWSKSWTAVQAQRAWSRGDYDGAQKWFRRSLARGQNVAWSLQWIAYADAYAGKQEAFREDLEALRKVDPATADEISALASDAGTSVKP